MCNMTDFIRKVFNAKRLLTRSQNTGNVAFEEADSLDDALARLAQSPVETNETDASGLSEPVA